MQIYYNQLDSKLRDNLKPIYIIAGNEIYQEETCVEKILKMAKKNSFHDHEVIYVEKVLIGITLNLLTQIYHYFQIKK